MSERWWWPFGRAGGLWACGERHPVYDGEACYRTRFHTGPHLHPDLGWWVGDEQKAAA